MFAKIDGELYKVNGNKMLKIAIKNGAIKPDGKVQDYPGGAYLLTANEVRRQYASLFTEEVKAESEELSKSDKEKGTEEVKEDKKDSKKEE